MKTEKILTVLLLAAAFFTGCRGRTDVRSDTNSTPVSTVRQVTDDLGRIISIPLKITRVVSLAPSVTENIFAVGAGDRLVGVTTFCNYPDEAKSIPKIGDTMNPNMESIVALKPEVVFVSTASQVETFMKTLDSNGIAVYVTNPNSLSEIFTNLEQFMNLFGTTEQADASLRALKTRVESVGHTISYSRISQPDPRVFVQISREPLFTIGKDSFLTQVIADAGGNSVTREVTTAYPKLSKETALALDPEVIILSDSEDNREPNEVFRNSPAVKRGRVYKVNADLLSRPGPRLVDALEQIARKLHP